LASRLLILVSGATFMSNYSGKVHNSKEKIHTEHFGAHSGSRAGLSDYNDGGFDHYHLLEEEHIEFDGTVAFGNENVQDDEDDYEKYHSGL
jgi:hypothetical protein